MEDRFPTNYSILLSGPPGVGKFEYLVERIRDDLRKGERVVFVTLDLHPNEIRARAKALHLDLEAVEGKSFVFVDCYSATTSERPDRKSTRLNSSHLVISYAVFCLKKKNIELDRALVVNDFAVIDNDHTMAMSHVIR